MNLSTSGPDDEKWRVQLPRTYIGYIYVMVRRAGGEEFRGMDFR